jgi:predicted DNA-binding transcriptional regulator AlpA
MPKPNPHVTLAPRGLRREQAAAYVGVSPSHFDKWIAENRMPKGAQIGGVTLWDRLAIDEAFNCLFDAPAPKSAFPSWEAVR